MRLVSLSTLRAYWEGHRDAEVPLRLWADSAARATWTTPQDVKRAYASASFVEDRIVFNIGGNNYRVVVSPNYRTSTLFIKFVGTHGEYDKIDVTKVEFKK